ncbi:sulfur-oxidizing protein SoxX [Poseidonocella pacifica]|uniref:Sulfur-oxidizing protein SoxX n=1 Tax=Poseidonocella pacifica TaxID=871651 RepID=A0A1I0VEX5_9RHOB|nr:sulfur oxidation c-type cytochrome SoxX [Poseidonocella pacifica]SFA75009.1 sulfur-oxidizing protein SoxX [Poseidonocella pacifica]
MKHVLLTLAAVGFAGQAFATPPVPSEVEFDEYGAVEASLTGEPGDPARGAEVMVTRSLGNCVACHQVDDLSEAPFHGEVGPPLNGVGGYRTEAELRGIVIDAKMIFPETMMPGFYKTTGFIRPGDGYTGKAAKEEDLEPILTAQQVEDVVAYLMTLQD